MAAANQYIMIREMLITRLCTPGHRNYGVNIVTEKQRSLTDLAKSAGQCDDVFNVCIS